MKRWEKILLLVSGIAAAGLGEYANTTHAAWAMVVVQVLLQLKQLLAPPTA